MIYNVYSVRDVKTSFAQPFIDSSNESAKRGFFYAFNQQNSMVNFSPADFSLYFIGTFDSDSGYISSEAVPVFICSAVEFINPTSGGSSHEE